eukprot:2109657-Prymnesium_polylepis.1
MRQSGAATGPAIVGFSEHIFSSLGSLGSFAASSEAVFGGLVQRTMANQLHSRYHYGHPVRLLPLHLEPKTSGLFPHVLGSHLNRSLTLGLRDRELPRTGHALEADDDHARWNLEGHQRPQFIRGRLRRNGRHAAWPNSRSSRVLQAEHGDSSDVHIASGVPPRRAPQRRSPTRLLLRPRGLLPVSYTHLTLPTICSV